MKAEQLRDIVSYFDKKKMLRDLGDVDAVIAAARSFLSILEPSDELVEHVAKAIAGPYKWSEPTLRASYRAQAKAVLAEIGGDPNGGTR